MEDVKNIKSILYIVSIDQNSEFYETKNIIAGYEIVKTCDDNGVEQEIYLDNSNKNGYITGFQLMKRLKNEKKPYEINWGFSYTSNDKTRYSILYQNIEQRDAAIKRDLGYDFSKVEAINISDLNLNDKSSFVQDVKSVAYIMGDLYDGLGFGVVEKYTAIKTIDASKNVYTIFFADDNEKKSYTYDELRQRIIDKGYLGIRWGYKYINGDEEIYSKTFNDIALRNIQAREELGYDFDKEEAISLNNMFMNIEPKYYSRISDVKSILYILEGAHIEEYQEPYNNIGSSEKNEKMFRKIDRRVIRRYVAKKVIGVNGMTQDIYLDDTNEKGFLTASELRKKLLNMGEYLEIGWGYAYKKDNKDYYFSNIYSNLEKRNEKALEEIDYDFSKENVPNIMDVLTDTSSDTLEQSVKKIG